MTMTTLKAELLDALEIVMKWGDESENKSRLIAALKAALAEQPADDERCPTCGEDGGTSCGMPNCGLIVGDEAEQPAPVVLTDAEIDSIIAKAHDGKVYPQSGTTMPKVMRRVEARAILAAAIPPGCVMVSLEKLESLRFVQRVLESDAPQADRDAAAQMVRDLRAALTARPGGSDVRTL